MKTALYVVLIILITALIAAYCMIVVNTMFTLFILLDSKDDVAKAVSAGFILTILFNITRFKK